MPVTETYANTSRSSLAADITSNSQTSITIANASDLPSSGNYRIRIGNEIMLVTGGQGTVNLTVARGQEGTTAGSSYATGTMIYQVVTKGTLDHLIQNHDHTSGVNGTIIGASYQPTAVTVGFDSTATLGTSGNLVAAGGSLLIPIQVVAPMELFAVKFYNPDTTLSRSWTWELYRQDGSTNILTQVAVGTSVDTWTASTATLRSIAPDQTTILYPGIYWVLIVNKEGTNNLGIVYATSGTLSFTRAQSKTITDGIVNSNLPTSAVSGWVKVSPDGNKYAYTGPSTTAWIVDALNGNTSAVSPAAGAINRLIFSPDGRFLYMGTTGNNVVRVNLSDNSYTTLATGSTSNLSTGLGILPDGSKLYFNNGNGTIYVINTLDMTNATNFSLGGTGNSHSFYVRPAGDYGYAIRASTGDMKVVRLSDNTVTNTVAASAANVTDGDLGPTSDGSHIAFQHTTAGTVGRFNVSNNTVGTTQSLGGSAVTRFSTIPGDNSNVLCMSSAAGSVYKWSAAAGGAASATYTLVASPGAGFCAEPAGIPGQAFVYTSGSGTYLMQRHRIAQNTPGKRFVDATAATWTSSTSIHGVYLSGKTFGSSGW